MLWNRFFHYYKVLLLQLGGFVISNTFLAPFIQTTLTLAINLLPWTMVSLTISSLFFTIVLPWIGPFFMSILLLSLCCPLVLMPQLLQVQGYPLSYFTRQIELLLNLFYKLSLYRTPRPYGVSLGPGLTPSK